MRSSRCPAAVTDPWITNTNLRYQVPYLPDTIVSAIYIITAACIAANLFWPEGTLEQQRRHLSTPASGWPAVALAAMSARYMEKWAPIAGVIMCAIRAFDPEEGKSKTFGCLPQCMPPAASLRPNARRPPIVTHQPRHGENTRLSGAITA